jgi:hypothetical protein
MLGANANWLGVEVHPKIGTARMGDGFACPLCGFNLTGFRSPLAPVPQGNLLAPSHDFWLRLTNDDGTPTALWAFVGIIAPTLVVLSIIAVAIIRY